MELDQTSFKKSVIPNPEEKSNELDKNKSQNTEKDIIVAESAEIYEEPLTDEDVRSLGSMKDVRYKTKDVALILDISEQTVRNYIEVFDDFLKIEKTSGGHRLFKSSDVEKLRNIIKLKNERKFTLKQTLEYIQGADNPDIVLSPDQRFEFLMKLLAQTVDNSIQKAMENKISLLEEKSSSTIETCSKLIDLVDEMSLKMDEKDQLIQQLIEENKQYSEKIEKLEQQANESFERYKDENTRNHENLVGEIKEIIDGKKKKKFFSWLEK